MLRYVVSPGRISSSTDEAADHLVARSAELARDGADVILLREKLLLPDCLAALTRRVVAACFGLHTRILVPGSAAAALAGGAHGVHLGGGAASPAAILQQMPQAWISVSCHTLEQVERARRDHVDAVLFAPVFGKVVEGVEVVPGVGLGLLRDAANAAAPVPVFALGGVTEANAAECLRAGAAGVAGIRMFFGPAGEMP